MKILFICKRFYTNKDLIYDEYGRLFHLPKHLASFGNSVEVIALDYYTNDNLKISYQNITYQSVACRFSRVFGLIAKAFRVFSVRRDAHRYDVVIASGDSHIGFLGLLIARSMKAMYVFDVYDYYPCFRSNAFPGMKWAFKYSTKHADLVTAASESLLKIIATNGTPIIIENGVDHTIFRPIPQVEARTYFKIDEDIKIVGYFGSININRGPLLIEAMKILLREKPGTVLLISGVIDNVNVDYPWIKYLGILEQPLVPMAIACCDVVSVPYSNDIFNSMCGACKIAEYLSCKKPIVATDVSDHRRYFGRSVKSLCTPDAESLAKLLMSQIDEPEILDLDYALDWEGIARKLEHNIMLTL